MEQQRMKEMKTGVLRDQIRESEGWITERKLSGNRQQVRFTQEVICQAGNSKRKQQTGQLNHTWEAETQCQLSAYQCKGVLFYTD